MESLSNQQSNRKQPADPSERRSSAPYDPYVRNDTPQSGGTTRDPRMAEIQAQISDVRSFPGGNARMTCL